MKETSGLRRNLCGFGKFYVILKTKGLNHFKTNPKDWVYVNRFISMIVKCVEKTGYNVSEELFSHHGWNKEMVFHQVSLNKRYVVYAILYIDDQPFYMICGDDYDGEYVKYPDLLPASLFEIVDERKSKLWLTRDKKGKKEFGFKELFKNEYFYGELVEGYEKEEKIFSIVKKKIDEENQLKVIRKGFLFDLL